MKIMMMFLFWWFKSPKIEEKRGKIRQMRDRERAGLWWDILLHILTIGSSEGGEEGQDSCWCKRWWAWYMCGRKEDKDEEVSTESRGEPILAMGSSERKPRSSRVFKVFGSPNLSLKGQHYESNWVHYWNIQHRGFKSLAAWWNVLLLLVFSPRAL